MVYSKEVFEVASEPTYTEAERKMIKDLHIMQGKFQETLTEIKNPEIGILEGAGISLKAIFSKETLKVLMNDIKDRSTSKSAMDKYRGSKEEMIGEAQKEALITNDEYDSFRAGVEEASQNLKEAIAEFEESKKREEIK